MQIVRNAEELTKQILSIKPLKVGFVPTMGCLHEGHFSLLRKSKALNDITVCSIFINPTQFNNPDDFKKYPVTTDTDIQALTDLDCDILFLPPVTEIYPDGYENKTYDLGALETIWEGEHRPGHFQGVCNVMDRLLEIVPADDLWMGQKDFQQCMVVQKLLALTNRTGIHFHKMATIREPSGLAMSSRNTRLSKDGLIKAPSLYEALKMIKAQYQTAPFSYLENKMKELVLSSGFDKVEYLAIALQESLIPAKSFRPDENYVAIAAAWIDGVRLIDNILL